MIQVVLITRTGKAYLANGIAAFTLDKEAYTPYSQLTATVYGNFSIQQFTGIYRVQLLLDGTELHFGTVEKFRLVQENGTSYVRFSSRGLTALLLQNQLEPGLHTAMSLDKLMQDFVTFPKEITWESDTDTSNYLFVKEGTSMWDGVANLTYKLCGRYPFVYHANEIRMHLPETYRNFYVGANTLLGMGMTADQSRIYSRFSMADADGTYGKFQENDPNAAALELVRTKQLPLDRQYLYDPQQALVFRRKFAGRGLVSYYFDRIGAVAADLGDRITCSGIIENAPITHIRMTGNRNGVRTRLEAYQDEFYPA
ncbi:hypothetical protein [Ruminococcus sp.]